ncbi:Crp/Fnr family transcriptional regulator [soil metagenome]
MPTPQFDNRLLKALPERDLLRLAPHLERVELPLGATLYEMEDPIDWIHLPEVGILSLITVLKSGAALETSIVGRDGGIGLIEALGSGVMVSRVIVQIPGYAHRLRARAFREAFDESPALRGIVHRHLERLLAETRQAVACHSLHDIQPRFCRWLLECREFSGASDVMPLKQEFLAVMLGVSRTAVTRVAGEAQAAGLIRYARGSLTILDKQGLEDAACECRSSLLHLRRLLDAEPAPSVRAQHWA